MARTKGSLGIGKMTDERIRIMLKCGLKAPEIGRRLGFTKQTIYGRIKIMTKNGIIGDIPLDFICEATLAEFPDEK